MTDDAILSLHRELDEKSRPRLAKCPLPSVRERSEDRAAQAFRAGIEAAGWSQRETARRLHLSERMVRDYLSGARQIPAWAPLALNRDGQVEYMRALLDGVPTVEADDLGQLTGTDG